LRICTYHAWPAQAKEKAYAEYNKFRIIQDKEYLSDFDKEIKLLKDKGLFDAE